MAPAARLAVLLLAGGLSVGESAPQRHRPPAPAAAKVRPMGVSGSAVARPGIHGVVGGPSRVTPGINGTDVRKRRP
jgi:hypothetical protein